MTCAVVVWLVSAALAPATVCAQGQTCCRMAADGSVACGVAHQLASLVAPAQVPPQSPQLSFAASTATGALPVASASTAAPPAVPSAALAAAGNPHAFVQQRLDMLKREGRYRYFFDIERQAGAFPQVRRRSRLLLQ